MLSVFQSFAFSPVMTALLSTAPAPAVQPDLRVQIAVQALAAGAQPGFRFRLIVELENADSQTIRLLSRRWRLIDADHRVVELRGACVADQRPALLPGASYAFATEIQLMTSWGSLEGELRVADEQDQLHELPLERWMLAHPASETVAH